MSTEQWDVSHLPRALVVHPDPQVLSDLCQILELAHFVAEPTDSLEEACGRVISEPFELIIVEVAHLSLELNDTQGLVSLLRGLPQYEFVPVVSVSDDPGAAVRAAELGLDLFVRLPLDSITFSTEIVRLHRRFAELQRRVAEEQRQFRQRILRTLSHEFRTPLVGITLGLELLEEMEDLKASRHVARAIDSIRLGTDRLLSSVLDFLLCQQIEAGMARRDFDALKQPLSASSIVNRYLDEHRDPLLAQGFSIAQEVDDGGTLVTLHRHHITLMLDRLLNNAVKFSPERKEIFFGVAREGASGVRIAIADRGIGIGENSEMALHPFSQPGREVLEQQGCGLGLTVVDGLVRINRGSFRLYPREGGGTIAEIVFLGEDG
jgi:signal transduction histidine kinase